jgi:hypothetical protein
MNGGIEWDDMRIARLSIWFTAYISWYILAVSSWIGKQEVWGLCISMGVGVLMATLTVKFMFSVLVVKEVLIQLVNWATRP